ncbi:MAG TPA: metallophosphoesterase [Salinimicrobium catena]|uniref:Metallophosphoesterase n=1 Tax=Salinimicrobium catena TaxID=390640 RepID=A0A7C2MD28_9FLAO|nr:metallophosphoesterase [Bacteroidales bacterium]HER39802.1 metallophosphoesterase [Salinimicrobium catena]
MVWNESHSPRELVIPGENYTIFSMGDSHMGGTANFQAFLEEAQNENATALTLVGDITTGQVNDYEVVESIIADCDTLAIFPIAGNHDLYFKGWDEFYSRFGSSTYSFTVKTPSARDLFICLDSGGGTLGSRQSDWLKSLLKNERNNYRYCVLFTHVNLFRPRKTSSTNPRVEEIHALLDLFMRYKVDMVVTGHDHEKNVQFFGNTMHIIMDALQDDNINAGYLRLDIDRNGIGPGFIRLLQEHEN